MGKQFYYLVGGYILENNCICRKVGRGCKGLQRYYLSYLDGDASHCVICIYYHNICEGSWQEIQGDTRPGHYTKLFLFGFQFQPKGKGLSLLYANFLIISLTYNQILKYVDSHQKKSISPYAPIYEKCSSKLRGGNPFPVTGILTCLPCLQFMMTHFKRSQETGPEMSSWHGPSVPRSYELRDSIRSKLDQMQPFLCNEAQVGSGLSFILKKCSGRRLS